MNAHGPIIMPLAAGENWPSGNWTVTKPIYSNGRAVRFEVKWSSWTKERSG